MGPGSRLKVLLGAARKRLNERWLNRVGLNLASQREINFPEVSAFLAWLFHEQPRVTCIQVGANDGNLMDPLKWLRREPAWHCWLLEPNPAAYQKLQYNTRGDPHTICLPVALGETPGRMPLHVLDPSLAPASLRRFLDVSLLSSLDLDSLLGCLARFAPDEQEVRSWIKTEDVAVVDWAHLLDQELDTPPDLVVIDTEGYDLKLLRSFPLDHCRPTAILFEHHWMEPAELTELGQHLEKYDYGLIRHGMDTLAVRKRILTDPYDGYPFKAPLPAPRQD